jgi:hypothetical protein
MHAKNKHILHHGNIPRNKEEGAKWKRFEALASRLGGNQQISKC